MRNSYIWMWGNVDVIHAYTFIMFVVSVSERQPHQQQYLIEYFDNSGEFGCVSAAKISCFFFLRTIFPYKIPKNIKYRLLTSNLKLSIQNFSSAKKKRHVELRLFVLIFSVFPQVLLI